MDEKQHIKEVALHAIDRAIKANQAYQSVLLKALSTLDEHDPLPYSYQMPIDRSSQHSFDTISSTMPHSSHGLHPFMFPTSRPSSPLSSMPITNADILTPFGPQSAKESSSSSSIFFTSQQENTNSIKPLITTPSLHDPPQIHTQSCEWSSHDRLVLRRAIRSFFSFYLIKKGILSLKEKITPDIDAHWPSIPESEIDWSHISLAYFRQTKSAMDCKVQWFSWDHPAYTKEPMLSEELQLLVQLRGRPDFKNWLELTISLPNVRSPIMVFYQYIMYLRARGMLGEKNRRKWTPEENALLTHATELFGHNSWVHVAAFVGTRDAKQCLHHWKAIDPAIRSGPFSQAEDEDLQKAYAMFGKKWNKVAKWVMGRTDSQCRERYTNLHDKFTRKGPWTEDENQCILAFVTLHGMKWSQLADWLPGRSDREVSFQYRKLRHGIEAGKRESPTGAQLPVDVRSLNQWMKQYYPIDLKKSFTDVNSGLIPPNSASLCALMKLLYVTDVLSPEELLEQQASGQESNIKLEGSSSQSTDSEVSLDISEMKNQAPSLDSNLLAAMSKHFLFPMLTGTIQPRPVGWKGLDNAYEQCEALATLVYQLHTSTLSEP